VDKMLTVVYFCSVPVELSELQVVWHHLWNSLWPRQV